MKHLLIALVVMLGATTAHADDHVLRIGDSKGMTKALLIAAGALDGLPYEVQWSEFAASAPALEALGANAIDLRGAAAAPLIFAVACQPRVRRPRKKSTSRASFEECIQLSF